MNKIVPEMSPRWSSRSHFILSNILVIIFILTGIKVSAQFQKPDISMPSPNAASIGLYGEVPVSLYTGTPNIDVPIYTIDEGKIKVPISLSYHASGVRVNQHPGWVGMNWNLNAGGAITRIVKGYQDETAYTAYLEHSPADSARHLGYYYKGKYLNSTNWDTKDFIKDLYLQPVGSGVLNLSKLLADTQPDEFNFNFLGFSGKFYMNYDRKWVVSSDSPFKVDFLTNRFTKPGSELGFSQELVTSDYYFYSYNGFILTAPDGMKYEFGGNTNAIEFSLPFFVGNEKDLTRRYLPGASWMADTWYLKKITTPEGQQVVFNYEVAPVKEGRFIGSFYRSLQNTYSAASASIKSSFLGILDATSSVKCESSTVAYLDSAYHYTGSLQRPTYLKEIVFQKGKVTFETEMSNELRYKSHILSARYYKLEKYLPFAFTTYLTGNNLPEASQKLYCLDCERYSSRAVIADNTIDYLRWRKLTSVTVKTNESVTANKYKFDYLDNRESRLYLTGVNKVSASSDDCKEFYKFTYYNDPANSLPDYLDRNDQTDHWGFFNKNAYNLELFPAGYESHKSASNSIAVLREGSLQKIEYPTGGTTVLEYEPHDAYKAQRFNADGSVDLESVSPSIGGLRVKKITNNDGTVENTKEYEYKFKDNNVEKSSGILNGVAKYAYSINLKTLLNTGDYNVSYFSSQNTLPFSANSFGTHIGYREVKEKLGDGSYNIHQFTNYESNDGQHLDEGITGNQRTENDGSLYDEKNSLSLERGKLLRLRSYNKDNIVVSENSFTYERFNDKYARALFANIIGICNTDVQAVQAYAYKNYAFQYLPKKVQNYTYDQADATKYTLDEVVYNYNGLGLQSEIRSTRNGKTSRTLNKYVFDYPTQTSPNQEQVHSLNAMKAIGLDGALIEQQSWNNETGTDLMVDGFLNFYRRYSANSGYNNIHIEKTMQWQNGLPIAGILLSDASSGLFNYNLLYNIRIGYYGEDNTTSYTLNGEPKQFTGLDGLVNSYEWNTGNKLGLLSSKKVGDQQTSFDYDNPMVGVSKITDPAGTFTTYSYDSFNRLETVKDYRGNLVQSYTYNLKNSTGCAAKPKIKAADEVDPVPDTDEDLPCSAPMITKSSGTTVCAASNQTVTLTASGCSGTVTWYRDGTQVGTGASYTGSAAGTYTATCTVGSCVSAASSGITVTQTSGCGSVTSVSCSGYTFTQGQVIGSTSQNVVIRIESGCAVAYWADGSRVNRDWIGLLNGKTIPDNVLSACVKWDGDALNCATCTTPSAPTITKSSGTTVCAASNQTVTLTASGCSGTVTWYRDGTQVGTGASYTGSAAGTYTATCTVGGCVSAVSSGIAVTQTSGCGSQAACDCGFSIVSASQNSGLYTAKFQFSSCSVSQIRWSILSGSTEIASGTETVTAIIVPFTVPSSVNSGSYTLKVDVLNCSGTSTIAFNYTKPGETCSAPTITKSSGTTVCAASNQTVTLTASGCSGTVTWYRDGTQVGTGASYTGSAAGTYTATCTVGSCVSAASSGLAVTQTSGCGSVTSVSCSGYTFTQGQIIGSTSTNVVIHIESGCAVAYWSTGGRVNRDWIGLLNGKTIPDNVLSACVKWDGDALNCATCTTPSAPTISKSSGTTVCAASNQTVTLTASGCSGTVTWYRDGTQVGTGASYTGSTAGTYTATCTVNSCVSAVSSGIAVTQTSGCGSQAACDCGFSIVSASQNSGLYTAKFQFSSCSVSQIRWSILSGSTEIASGTETVTSGTVPFTVPSSVNSGSYTLKVDVLNCSGTSTIAFNYTKPGETCSAPTITKSSGTTVCAASNQTVTLTASGCSGTVTWYRDGTQVGTGASYTGSAAGTYTATCTVGSCVSAASSGITVTQTSGCGSVTSVSCSGYTFTQGQVIGSTSTNVVIHIESGCAVAYWSTGGRVNRDWIGLLNGKTIPDNVLSACVKWDGDALNCVACTTLPSAPTISKSSGTTVCAASNQTVTLTASGCSGTVTWYRDGTQVGTGASYTGSVAGTYTATCTVNSCVSAVSSGIAVTQTSGCGSQAACDCGFSIVSASQNSGLYTAKFEFSSCSASQIRWSILSGSTEIASGTETVTASIVPFTVPSSVNSGSYTLKVDVLNCSGTSTIAFNYTKPGETCSAPTITKSSGTTVCAASNQTVTLTASGCSGTVTWYRDGTQVGTGASYTGSAAGTYTATCTVGSCVSAASSGITVTQTSGCGSVTSVSCSGYTFTQGQVIGSTSQNVVIRIESGCAVAYWADGSRVNRDWIGLLNGKTIPDNVLSACVKWEGDALNCVACTTLPSAPTISKSSGTTVCAASNQTVTLTASGCSGTVTWYRDGTQVGTGASYTGSVAGTYTATCTVNSCVSAVSSGIAVTQTSGCGSQAACDCGFSIVSASQNSGLYTAKFQFSSCSVSQIRWSILSGSTEIASGTETVTSGTVPFTVPFSVNSGSYTLKVDVLNCSGTSTIAFNYTKPGETCTAPSINKSSGTTVCAVTSQSVTLTASGSGTITWYKDGIQVGTGISYTTSAAGTYTAKATNGSCVSESSPSIIVTANCPQNMGLTLSLWKSGPAGVRTKVKDLVEGDQINIASLGGSQVNWFLSVDNGQVSNSNGSNYYDKVELRLTGPTANFGWGPDPVGGGSGGPYGLNGPDGGYVPVAGSHSISAKAYSGSTVILTKTLNFTITGCYQTTVNATQVRDARVSNLPAIASVQNTNYGSLKEIAIRTWGESSSTHTQRSLVTFSELESIPQGATIISATLYLSGVSQLDAIDQSNGNTPLGISGWLERVTSSWQENTVTWSNKPSTTTDNQVSIPASNQKWDNNVTMDVSQLVRDMVALPSAQRYGFGMRLKTEGSSNVVFVFSSNEATNVSKRPRLQIVYSSCP